MTRPALAGRSGTDAGLVIHVDYSVWAWVHLLLGAVIILAGVGVLAGNIPARSVGGVWRGSARC